MWGDRQSALVGGIDSPPFLRYNANPHHMMPHRIKRDTTMNLAHPLSDLVPGAAGAILQRLAMTTEGLTGHQIADLSAGAVSQSGVSRALGRLVRSGLVEVQPVGRANLYRLNRDHVLAPAIVGGAEAVDTLLERITESVKAWPLVPDAVWVFGSVARGQGGSDSDVDLLLVRPSEVPLDDARWADQTARLLADVAAWSGNECGLLEYTVDELSDLADAADPLADSLRSDAVALVGRRPAELLGLARR
jgi:DNA-binding transcriptional ArsR family regulator